GQDQFIPGTPYIKNYPVPGGNAETIAKTLQEIYPASRTLRISAINSNTIMVYATPNDHWDIAKQIGAGTEKGQGVEKIPLTTLEAGPVAEKLKLFFGDPTKDSNKTGAPIIEAETTLNAIIVRGTPGQIEEVRAAIKVYGEVTGSGDGTGAMRVISL